jgi:outer membrane receptor protein involved in Fe transport
MQSRLIRGQLLATTIIAGAAALAHPALAQDATAPTTQCAPGSTDPNCAPAVAAPATSSAVQQAQAAAASSEIVVTGSRIARPELQSPTPVTIVGAQQIANQGITNIQDMIQKLPQAGIPGLSKTNSNFLTSDNGVATINLRNLGDSRTLVLVNGRRFVPGVAGTSIVDINDIPTDFIDHIEVVTGGASSIYGSDAVAGVVNFILKDHMDGITAHAQYGISSRGDDRDWSSSITGGKSFDDGRGGFIANFSYDKDYGLLSKDRAISTQDCGPAGCGPQSYSTYASQGYFTPETNNVGPLSVFTFDKNNNYVDGFPSGSGYNRQADRRISTPVERYLASANAHYDFSDAAKFYLEGTYVKVKSSAAIEPFAFGSDANLGGQGIQLDNPYIPAQALAGINAYNATVNAGIASGAINPDTDKAYNTDDLISQIAYRRRLTDVFSRDTRNSRDTFRIAGGIKGDISSKWSYDVSAVYGQLIDHTSTQDINVANFANAVDAIEGPDGPECRSAAARAAGCVPIDLFGHNTSTAAGNAYVAAEPRAERVKNTEFVADANITGSLFALPYGDVKVNVGAEYRREKSTDDWDELTNEGLNTGNQIADTVGKFNVKEVFGEIDVPLLKDLPFVKSLSVNGAARYSDYSTIGHVFSWNVGGEYAPIDDFHVRANYAIANRAPNISELYSPPSETFPSVDDPCNGVTSASNGQYAAACREIPGVANAIKNGGTFVYSLADSQGINGFVGGNPELKKEEGKTLTLGGVFTPHPIPGLSLTVDYFNIKVSNAIGTVPLDTSVEQCLLTSNPVYCQNVIRNPTTGKIVTVNAQNINVAKLATSGIDFGLKYGRNLGADTRIDLSVQYTLTLKYKTQSDPTAPVDNGLGNIYYGEAFRHKVNADLLFSFGKFSVDWQTTYLSAMKYQPESIWDTPGTIAFLEDAYGDSPALATQLANQNSIKARFYHDVQFRARAGDDDRFEFYLGVNNLFDRKPPQAVDTLFANTTGTETFADIYDPFGRRFYAGVQVHF